MLYHLEDRLALRMSLDQAWAFFSQPANLRFITPPHLKMDIISQSASEMYAGMIISYRIFPLLGIPLTWVTEITHVRPNEMFVDEQRAGPYRMWHHQHFFKAVPGGTEVRDVVDYLMPLGPLGALMHALVVGRQVRSIFDYRRKILGEKFGLL